MKKLTKKEKKQIENVLNIVKNKLNLAKKGKFSLEFKAIFDKNYDKNHGDTLNFSSIKGHNITLQLELETNE